MARRLISIRRRVPAGGLSEYRRRWSAAREAIEAAGAHAWAFSSAREGEHMIEFLEFAEAADPRSDSRVAAALAALDREHEGTTEEWEEAG